MTFARYEDFMLPPHDWVPNNARLPVLLYAHALDASRGELAQAFETRFDANGWPPQWRDGVFDYHHFHSTAHEVLGVVSGRAVLIIGGPGGRRLTVEAGDALLLPAGTGHCLESSEGRFGVVGAYPPDQQWDIRRDALKPAELEAMLAVPYPVSDPVDGKEGPLMRLWPVQ